MNSGALATDFQGGFITVRDVEAITEIAGSPGIYTAGKSIITAYNSRFVSKGCEGVMVAHSLGHTYLYDCEVTGTVALNTHNSMSDEYSYIHMFGGELNSTEGSILCAEDGKAVMNLEGVVFEHMADGNITYAKAGGKLVANLAQMDVKGDLAREKKSYLEVNLKETKLSGAADASAMSLDAASQWTITGDSRVAKLTLAEGAKLHAEKPVTVTYGTLEGVLPTVENVTFVQDDTVVDDYEAKKMGPPPGMPGMPGGAPGMPPMPGDGPMMPPPPMG